MQACAVDLARVARCVLDPHRSTARDPVEHVTVGVRAVQEDRVEARGDDPVVGTGASGPFRQDAVDVVERADPGQVGLHQRRAEPDGVGVGVVETGQNGPLARVDPLAGLHPVQVLTHRDDMAVQHGERVHHRLPRVTGVNACVLDEEIDQHRSPTVSSRASSTSLISFALSSNPQEKRSMPASIREARARSRPGR